MLTNKKVVILHDWLTGYRGGERVLEAICELFPDAPIYTLIHKPGSTSPTIESRKIVTSWLNKIPGIHENYRYFLPLMPLAVNSLKIDPDTDLVISSSHCVIKGVKKPSRAKHISYIHSPMRYMYDQFDTYFNDSGPIIQFAARIMRPYLRTWDYISNSNIDLILANSNFVKWRIENFYHRSANVVYPFVDLKDFEHLTSTRIKKDDYFIVVSAFAPNKKIDVAIRAFNHLGLELRIIGSGNIKETSTLKSVARSNIKFLGNLSRSDVIGQFACARALVFPGVEDFGIVPLEAMAAGTPVIALKSGGVLDSLNNECAIFFNYCDEENLITAIKEFESRKFDEYVLRQRAEDFSKSNFQQKILQEINNLL